MTVTSVTARPGRPSSRPAPVGCGLFDDRIKTIDVLMGKDVYALLEDTIDKCEVEDLNP